MEHSLNRSRMTIDSYLSAVKKDMAALRKDMKAGAETRVKAKLALEAIVEKEKLEVAQADIDKEIEILAQNYGKSLDEYRSEISNDALESIKDYMLKEKAVDLVISKSKVEAK
jgi:trigger factor